MPATAPPPVQRTSRSSSNASTIKTTFGLAASETRIHHDQKTDPEIQCISPVSSELSQSTMPAVPRVTAKPQPSKDERLQKDYLKLATLEDQRAFKKLSQEYRALERKLVNLEEGAAQSKPTSWVGALGQKIAQISQWFELRNIKSDIARIRKEEQALIKSVHAQADQTGMMRLKLEKGTPAILQRASIPESRQGKLPPYNQLVTLLKAQVEQSKSSECPLTIRIKEQAVVISRKNSAGEIESMMFSDREDGKVSYFKKVGADNDWTREATLWNDSAHSVAVAFSKGKAFPNVLPAKRGVSRVLAPVQLDKNWAPGERA